jgi:hypothetical protein
MSTVKTMGTEAKETGMECRLDEGKGTGGGHFI